MIRALKSVYYGLALALLILISAFTVNYAMSTYNTSHVEVSEQDICRIVGDYSMSFMGNRQSGVSLSDARKEFKNSNPPMIISDILDMVLTQAYAHPIVDDKVNAVLQFGVMYMSSCFARLENEEIKGQEI